MIYSNAFERLPQTAKDAVYAMLFQVLSGALHDSKYTQLLSETRRAVLEILTETKPEFAHLTARTRRIGQ